MDYNVFILARVREAYVRGLSTENAVVLAIKSTAGVVTSAAIVMVAVFGTFATLSALELKQMGVGLAAAVLIDATVIRGVLLPATMKLLGDWNWYIPARLERLLPRIEAEPSALDTAGSVEAPLSPIESAGSGLWEPATLMAEAQAALDRSPRRCALATVKLDTAELDRRLGTGAADALAVAAITRLARTLRPGDGIAATGRGRFALLITDLQAPLDAWKVAGRVVDRLRAPFNIADKMVVAGPAVAVVVGTNELTSADELLEATESGLEAHPVEGVELAVVGV